MCIMSWPILLSLTLVEYRRNKNTLERDVSDDLYGKLTYIFTKTIVNLFPSLFIWLIYLVPSYSMCGLYMQNNNNYDGFYLYIGLMLLYLSCIQIFITAFIYMIPMSNASTILSSVFLSGFFLSSGYAVHFKDMSMYTTWIQYISPNTWLLPYLLNREYTTEAITSSSITTLCRNKQVITSLIRIRIISF